VPGSITIWLFRERLAETGKDKQLWAELQRQLDKKGFKIRKDVSQDASFIEADLGPSGKPRGGDATMMRGIQGHPLGFWDQLRSNRIVSKRRPVERVFALLKRGFGCERVLVASLEHVMVKLLFICFCFI
jgi:IS5 family transposase